VRNGFAKSTAILSAGTLISRLLGLVREQLFALTLGASAQTDAFNIAFRIPNLLRDLFAEGALSAAFIPAYSRADHESAERGFDLTRRLLTLLALVLTLICALAIVVAPWIVSSLAPGFAEIAGKSELTIGLTRVMMPILPFISFAAVAMGILNSRDRFALPAVAPALFNVVNIAIALALHKIGLPADQVAYGWAVGALLGSAAQFVVQWPGLRSEGFSFRPDFHFRDPFIRDILTTMAPATVALAAVQINIFISSRYVSTEPSAVSWLNFAFRLLYLPMGLFGVAVGSVAGARLSRSIAQGAPGEAHAQIAQALRLLLFLTLPSAAGLMCAGPSIVRLIYEHGAFKPSDTVAVARALAWMSLGLVAYASTKVFVPYFYALKRPRVPLIASLMAVAANLLTLLLLFDSMGFLAAGLGMALGNLTNGAFLLGLYRGPESLIRRVSVSFLASLSVATLGMVAVVMAAISGFDATAPGLWPKVWGALVPITLGVATYFALALAFRIPEATRVLSQVRERLAR
jgi:putative peptidoglycan lipid II flippase